MDDSDMYNGNDSDYDLYTRKSRHMRDRMSRMDRRTALSLRPISQKCYTDPHSPLHFNSDFEETGVRRSKRQRKVQFDTMSWLADDQMHKIGYPNPNPPVGYSEEDSLPGPPESVRRESSRRSARHSEGSAKRREVKNPKYLFDYETNEVSPRRRRSEVPLLECNSVVKRELRSRKESNDKENKVGTRSMNGRAHRLRSRKMREVEAGDEGDDDEDEDVDDDDMEEKKLEEDEETSKEPEENGEVDDQNGDDEEAKNNIKQESSESDELPKLRRRVRNNTNIMMNQGFPSRRTRNQKTFADSTSESENGPRKYSLRNRVPKPAPQTINSSVLRTSRRCFSRRRKSSSSSDSSSDADSRDKYTKAPKSPHSKNDQRMMKSGAGQNMLPIDPETLDTNVRFSSIGGLDGHITCLKEMIQLPMMYPEVYDQFKIDPPRGVLFYGPPGTGKTLIARALANECCFGTRKVSFFMRKGADLLSKWIGESEKQLRMLFAQAAEMQPSIIFFDELDGLAPVRSARQDQIHASIVSTLLALMDGLDKRGEVIVIGATNRIDAIDPALRRPGRFDRELYFPLPGRIEREAILRVHVSKWKCRPSNQMIKYLAERSHGYCGSDLMALCSEAVMRGFQRIYPQVYKAKYKLLLNPESVQVDKIDFLRAKSMIVPASQRMYQGLGRKLHPCLEALFCDALKQIFSTLEETFPHGLNPHLAKVKLSSNIKPSQLLLLGESSDCGQTQHLAPAILHRMEHVASYNLDLANLFKLSNTTPEEACLQVFNEAKRNVPSVIYIPNINTWWALVSETVKAILESQLSQVEPNVPILLLATADTTYDNLPNKIKSIFSRYRKEVFQLDLPDASSREAFLRPLFINSCLKAPRLKRKRPLTPPPLPRAPTPPPMPLTDEQAKKVHEKEEHTLRELRIFLRDICKKLASNRLYFMFTKPVDTLEVPDYPTIIKQPMDLETMMTKVDLHRYECAKDFLRDIELIVQNALEYNPARTSADKQIRHRACSLRDYAYTLIKNEMDSDFEGKCQDIAHKRYARKASNPNYLPPSSLPAYIQTPENINLDTTCNTTISVQTPLTTATKEGAGTNQKPIRNNCESNENGNCAANTRRKRSSSNVRSSFIFSRKRRKRTVTGAVSTGVADESTIDKGSSDNSRNGHIESPMDDVTPPSDSPPVAAADGSNDKSNTRPLSINCDTTPTTKAEINYLQSPRHRLSEIMSPSELLPIALDFDDIDQALNESCENVANKHPIQCSKDALEQNLQQAVKLTEGCSVQDLLDLYNQLGKIVGKYANTHLRNNLPKELEEELTRFKNENNFDSTSEISQSSSQSRSC